MYTRLEWNGKGRLIIHGEHSFVLTRRAHAFNQTTSHPFVLCIHLTTHRPRQVPQGSRGTELLALVDAVNSSTHTKFRSKAPSMRPWSAF